MEKDNVNFYPISDQALLAMIGKFIQDTRLQQNKTQQETALAAGINRSTLSQVENGSGGTLLTLIQLLRVLDQLPILNTFKVENKISPLQLAKLAQNKRHRARRGKQINETGYQSSW